MNSTFSYLLLLGIFFVYFENVSEALERELIVNGDLGKIEDFKYMVKLDVDTMDCSGSIIGSDLILTAAHCFYDDDGKIMTSRIRVTAGVDDLHDIRSSTRVINFAIKVYVLKKYHKKRDKLKEVDDDIAVVRVRIPFDFAKNKNLRKLKLAEREYDNVQPVISGFGNNKVTFKMKKGHRSKMESTKDGKLRFSKTDIISKKQCQKIYTNRIWGIIPIRASIINERKNICARMPQPDDNNPNKKDRHQIQFDKEATFRGACTGDSGSPLVVDGEVLIGVLSYNDFTCNEGKAPSIYTKVYYYKNFVDSVINDRIDEKKVHVETLNSDILSGTYP